MIDAAEFGNLLVGAWLLMGELVAGKAHNGQSPILILLVQGLQAIVLRGKTALGCGVHNEENLAFELCEVKIGALVIQGLEVINLCHIYFIYIVHDANIQLYFYIASDILKKVKNIYYE